MSAMAVTGVTDGDYVCVYGPVIVTGVYRPTTVSGVYSDSDRCLH